MNTETTTKKETVKKTTKTSGKYIEAVGRRKTSVARVRLFESSKNETIVNDRVASEYFPTDEMRTIVTEAISKSKLPVKFKISAKIVGGGVHSQAEALRHGISRALVKYDEELRKKLKQAGFLKRDPRAKERKKFGLKGARKAAQWSKR